MYYQLPVRRAAGGAMARIACAVCLASIALASCATQPQTATTQAFEITFDARVGDQPLRCGETYDNVGTTGAQLLLQDFRVYVSNFRLIDSSGAETSLSLTPDALWQNDSVALLDFEDATGNCNGNAPMNHVVRGAAPVGDYVGLAFDLGVPQDLNHQDPTVASAPLNYSALTWPWRAGYKYTTIDLETGRAEMLADNSARGPQQGHMAKGSASGFSIHLGATDCGAGSPTTPPETPCANQNRPEYRLASFDPHAQTVVLDVGMLLATTDVTVNAPNSPSGCMAFPNDDDCVAIMDSLGLLFRGKPSSGQNFVRVE